MASLHWRLYATLRSDLGADPALAPLAAYLADDDPLEPWTLASELGNVFEKYQAWRRDWLLRWEAGADPDDVQARLWRRIASGRAYRARRIGQYLDRYARPDGPLPQGLPPRLFAFAVLNISPTCCACWPLRPESARCTSTCRRQRRVTGATCKPSGSDAGRAWRWICSPSRYRKIHCCKPGCGRARLHGADR